MSTTPRKIKESFIELGLCNMLGNVPKQLFFERSPTALVLLMLVRVEPAL